jgi:hypothetical protein
MAWATSSAKTIGWKTVYASKEESVKAILLALFLVLAATFSIREHDPPAAISTAAPADVFSAARAAQHLAVIAEQPHAIGYAGHQKVQDYLLQQLAAAGVDPQIHSSVTVQRGASDKSDLVQVVALANILARLKGTGGGKAVLLMAHYDSLRNSFGASDNGAAVASLLETLRALKAGPPLKNDVIFLFTDGEEDGLLGARAFTTEHQWVEDVGVALNFDARGNRGPVIMFETSQNNGWLIEQFGEAAPYPMAHSLSYELYRLLPNDTDLTLFKKAGIPGLNFANIDGIEGYHSPLDNLQSVDQNTVQHRGSYALALARHFGNVDLIQARARNAVYFDLFGSTLIRYSTAWVIPLTLLVFVVFVAVVVLGFKRRKLSLRGIVVGFIALFVSLLVASLAGWLLWRVSWMIRPGPSAAATQSRLLLFAFVALAIAITVAVYTFVRERANMESVAVGSLVWWLFLLVITSLFVPGATFVLQWPLLFSLIGLGWMMFSNPGKRTRSLVDMVVLGLCAIPAMILMAPVIYQIFVGLTLNFSFLVIALLVLLLGLLLPQLRLIATPFKWALPGAVAVAAIVLLIVGVLSNAATTDRSATRVFYAFNADTGKAVWAGDTSQPDERVTRLLAGSTEKGSLADFAYLRKSREYSLNAAPLPQMGPPEISIVEDKSSEGIRTLKMRVYSPRQAGVVAIYLDSSAQVLNASVNNTLITDEPKDRWGMQIDGVPRQGVEVQMQVKATEQLKLRLVDQTFGLPAVNGVSNTQAVPSANPDLTMFVKAFSL